MVFQNYYGIMLHRERLIWHINGITNINEINMLNYWALEETEFFWFLCMVHVQKQKMQTFNNLLK